MYFQYNYISQIQTLAQIHFALSRMFYAVIETTCMCLSLMYVVKVSSLIFSLRTLTVLGLSYSSVEAPPPIIHSRLVTVKHANVTLSILIQNAVLSVLKSLLRLIFYAFSFIHTKHVPTVKLPKGQIGPPSVFKSLSVVCSTHGDFHSPDLCLIMLGNF